MKFGTERLHPEVINSYPLLLFNKLSLCPYMVRKPSISVILHDRYPAIYVNDHIWKCTADFLSLLVCQRLTWNFHGENSTKKMLLRKKQHTCSRKVVKTKVEKILIHRKRTYSR